MYQIKTLFIFSCVLSLFTPDSSLWGMGERNSPPPALEHNFGFWREGRGATEDQEYLYLLEEMKKKGFLHANGQASFEQAYEALTEKPLSQQKEEIDKSIYLKRYAKKKSEKSFVEQKAEIDRIVRLQKYAEKHSKKSPAEQKIEAQEAAKLQIYTQGLITRSLMSKDNLADTAKTLALTCGVEVAKIIITKKAVQAVEWFLDNTFVPFFALFQDHSTEKLVESVQYAACLKKVVSPAAYKATRARLVNSVDNIKRLKTPQEVAYFQQMWADASALGDAPLTLWMENKFCALTNQTLPKEFKAHEQAMLDKTPDSQNTKPDKLLSTPVETKSIKDTILHRVPG